MGKRKHISWKTKYAAALLKLGDVPYTDAVKMTEDQFISLYEIDHNIYHHYRSQDAFWNLEPMLIAQHRAKTRKDAKIIAKGRRLRENPVVLMADALSAGIREGCANAFERMQQEWKETGNREARRSWGGRKIRSRGFDKRFKRKMDGTVVKR